MNAKVSENKAGQAGELHAQSNHKHMPWWTRENKESPQQTAVEIHLEAVQL